MKSKPAGQDFGDAIVNAELALKLATDARAAAEAALIEAETRAESCKSGAQRSKGGTCRLLCPLAMPQRRGLMNLSGEFGMS